MSPVGPADPTPASGAAGTTEGIDGDGLDELRRFGIRQTWPAGATLLRQGERPQHLYVIERGEVAVWDESGRAHRFVQTVRAGASVGDLPVLLDQPSLYTAITRRETATLGFSREMVLELLTLEPQICFLWFRLLSRRIEPGYPRNVALAGRSASERVARFLLTELEGSDLRTIELSQAALASAVGLSRQRVSHVLGVLEGLGVIERGHGVIVVVSRDRLRAMLPR